MKKSILSLINQSRHTKPLRMIAFVRIMLAVIFMMTGVMKIALPKYGDAWAIQLQEAQFPLYSFIYWFVPVFEIITGVLLLIGFLSRLSAVSVIFMMIVAVYVHLTVLHPGAFPSQPQKPYMPIMVIIWAFAVLKKGAGSWSMDLAVSKT